MNCEMDHEELLGYLDGDLDREARQRVAEHIVGCDECRRVVDDLRDVSQVLTRWSAPEPANLPSARDLLDRAGPTAGGGGGGTTASRRMASFATRWGAIAAVLLVTVFVGLFIVRNPGGFDRGAQPGTLDERPDVTAPKPEAPAPTTPDGTLGGSTESTNTELAPGEEAGAKGPDEKDAIGESKAEVAQTPSEAPAVTDQVTVTEAEGAERQTIETEKSGKALALEPAAEPAPPPPPAATQPPDAGAVGPTRNRAATRPGAGGRAASTSQLTSFQVDSENAESYVDRASTIAAAVGGKVERSGYGPRRRITITVPATRYNEAVGRVQGLQREALAQRSKEQKEERFSEDDAGSDKDSRDQTARRNDSARESRAEKPKAKKRDSGSVSIEVVVRTEPE